jgi:serine/threonine protein kinase
MEALLIILCYAISGVTLYCMLRGSLPFEADNPLDLFEAIKEQE